MTDEYVTIRAGDEARLETADFEHVLERLITIADAQGRGFLAYLLSMALIHLHEDRDPADIPH
jgi:hypothetical protein